jgi:eukaryotic-like serine/threonine-protein kinase
MTDPTATQKSLTATDLHLAADIVADKTVISAPPNAPQEREELFRSVTIAEVARVLEGRTLDHFVLERLIGGGGMGAVFRGRDTRLDRTVAIKVVPSQRRDAEALRRFRSEAQAAARLDHPNIARVYYVGEAEAWNYIVFEYIDGINIRDLIDREGPLSIDDAVYYTRQVAEALQHAQERDVVHRDIKPSNLLVTTAGHVKLVDMGLARSTSQDRSSADLTASGVTLGTFDYISPEQARDPRDADVRSDLYSLGCTLYFMLTGEPPFPDGTALQKLLSHGSQPPPDPRRFRPELGDELIAIIMKLMAKKPADRYQKPLELVGDLILLADLEHLPKSRMPGSMTITPTIAQRSLIETHLPWLLSAAVLVISTLWIQNVESWSASYTLPQPRIAALEEVSLPANPLTEKETTSPATTETQSPPEPSKENADTNPPSRESTSSGSLPKTPVTRNESTTPVSESGAPVTSVTPNVAGIANSATGLPSNAGLLNGSTLSGNAAVASPSSSFPVKMVDDRYGPGPRNNKSTTSDTAISPNTPPPIGATAPRVDASNLKNVDSLLIADDPLTPLAPNQVKATNLQEALLTAKQFPDIKRIQLATSSVKLTGLIIPRSGLTIEAAEGFMPLLSYTVESPSVTASNAEVETATAMVIGNHQIVFRGIEFRLTSVDSMRRGALFRVSAKAGLTLERCVVTLNDPLQRGLLSAVEVSSEPNNVAAIGSIADGTTIDPVTGSVAAVGKEADPLQVRVEDVIIRGEGDWLTMADSQRAELRFDNGLIAISGRLLSLGGTTRREARPLTLRVFMDRITCVALGGLATIDIASGQYPVCFVRQANACSFATATSIPLIRYSIKDESTLPTAELLQIRGEDNAYDVSVESVSELSIGGKPPKRYSLGNATSDWFQDRALETSVRWVNSLGSSTALSKQTAESYMQRGAMFVPGFQVSRLPRIGSPAPAGGTNFPPVISP